MRPEDRPLASPRRVTLRDGRAITIRLIEAADLPAMVAFYRDVPKADAVYYRGTSEALVAGADAWVPAAADGAHMVCLVLADDTGAIHGEAWYEWKADKPEMSTFGICIRRTMQGQGAGRHILSRLMEIGDTFGPPTMNLTVQKENERAWKLYTSAGFVQLREQMRAAREDAPPMSEFYMERKMGTAGGREARQGSA